MGHAAQDYTSASNQRNAFARGDGLRAELLNLFGLISMEIRAMKPQEETRVTRPQGEIRVMRTEAEIKASKPVATRLRAERRERAEARKAKRRTANNSSVVFSFVPLVVSAFLCAG